MPVTTRFSFVPEAVRFAKKFVQYAEGSGAQKVSATAIHEVYDYVRVAEQYWHLGDSDAAFGALATARAVAAEYDFKT